MNSLQELTDAIAHDGRTVTFTKNALTQLLRAAVTLNEQRPELLPYRPIDLVNEFADHFFEERYRHQQEASLPVAEGDVQ